MWIVGFRAVSAGRQVAVLTVRAALAGSAAGRSERLVHDPPDGAGTTSALGAAAEAAVDLARGARRLGSVQRRAHIRVAEYVTGTDDHWNPASQPFSTFCNYRYRSAGGRAKEKRQIYTYSNLARGRRLTAPADDD